MLSRPRRYIAALIAATFTVATTNIGQFTLPYIFRIELQLDADFNPVVYPYGGGQRVSIAVLGGSMSTLANGNVGTVLSGFGGEQGNVREDGVPLIDTRAVLQIDQHFDPSQNWAFLQMRGKSFFGAEGNAKGLHYIEFETDSPAFEYLNGFFLAGNLSRDGMTLKIDVYGASPSTI